jgi:hypothetical protein
VTAGKLSKDQEAKLLAGLASHLDDLVNGVHKGFGFRHGHHGRPGGPDGSWGPKDGSPPPAAPADAAPAPATA